MHFNRTMSNEEMDNIFSRGDMSTLVWTRQSADGMTIALIRMAKQETRSTMEHMCSPGIYIGTRAAQRDLIGWFNTRLRERFTCAGKGVVILPRDMTKLALTHYIKKTEGGVIKPVDDDMFGKGPFGVRTREYVVSFII